MQSLYNLESKLISQGRETPFLPTSIDEMKQPYFLLILNLRIILVSVIQSFPFIIVLIIIHFPKIDPSFGGFSVLLLLISIYCDKMQANNIETD